MVHNDQPGLAVHHALGGPVGEKVGVAALRQPVEPAERRVQVPRRPVRRSARGRRHLERHRRTVTWPTVACPGSLNRRHK